MPETIKNFDVTSEEWDNLEGMVTTEEERSIARELLIKIADPESADDQDLPIDPKKPKVIKIRVEEPSGEIVSRKVTELIGSVPTKELIIVDSAEHWTRPKI